MRAQAVAFGLAQLERLRSGRMRNFPVMAGCALLLLGCTSTGAGPAAARPPPLRVLWVGGGVFHDYDALIPNLTEDLRQRLNATIDVKLDREVWRDASFAEKYAVLVYQFCRDDADGLLIDHALAATRSGKPTVMVHCAVHSFRHSDRVGEWERCCGMRSKVHDPYQPFATVKLDRAHPITAAWPDDWTTAGDELYQTIELLAGSHPLLQAKSPQDGREHVVAWTNTYGSGRVFGVTLGHDLKSASLPSYHRLLADGLLWATGRL